MAFFDKKNFFDGDLSLKDPFPFLLAICTIHNLIKVKIQVVSGQQVVEENHDSVAKTSLVLESFSESDMSSNDDGQRQNQNHL